MLYLQTQVALIGGLQGPELIFLLAIVLIFFGAKKLPELAKGLGQGIKEFKKATKDVQQDLHQAMEEDAVTSAPPRKAADPATTIPQAGIPDLQPQTSQTPEGAEMPQNEASDASKV
jgi:sec-independent protein translocase protein TatA